MSSIGDLAQLLKQNKRVGSDYTGVVTRVEGGTAYVRLTGSDIMDTPVAMSIDAKVGDTVRVRVKDGKAWVAGNDTAPPTNDTASIQKIQSDLYEPGGKVSTITKIIEKVGQIAANTSQYFWHTQTGTDTGVHITEVPRETFLKDPENGGGNLLARSNGIAVRDGLTELAQFKADGIDFFDSYGANVVDVDTNNTNYTSEFTYPYSIGVGYLESGQTKYEDIQDPYFLNFTNYSGKSYNGVIQINLGVGASTTFTLNVDFTDDFTVTSHGIQIVYSHETNLFAYTNTTENEIYIADVFVSWNASITSPTFSFGRNSDPYRKGPFSGIMGEGLEAMYANQFVVGRYNDNQDYNMFEVGGGANAANCENLFEVRKSTGNVYAKGAFGSGNIPLTQDNLGILSGIVSCPVSAGSYADYTVWFNKTFSAVPTVVVGFVTNSEAGAFGKCCCAALLSGLAVDSFVIRVFNGDTTGRSPQVSWIAIGH